MREPKARGDNKRSGALADEPLVALVTGGSRGVGAATAQALARAGFRVAITYRNKRERAGEVVERVRQEEGAGDCPEL